MQISSRLHTLDGMRGIAAVAVVMLHLGALRSFASGGYLAVDLFFVLSGFVIARTYEPRLTAGLARRAFLRDRLIRLYPMYLLGLLLATMVACALLVNQSRDQLDAVQIGWAFATELLMFPSPVNGKDLFPLNGPAWTLCLELVVNILFFVIFVNLARNVLISIVVLAGILLLACALYFGSLSIGHHWDNAVGGIARVMFSFPVGMLIARAGLERKVRRSSSWAILCAVVLVACLTLDVPDELRPFYDLSFALLISPILVVIGAQCEPPAFLTKPFAALGDLSYPLYAIHFPLVYVGAVIGKRLDLPVALWAPGVVLLVVLAAHWVARYVDRPARALLADVIAGRPRTAG